MQMPMKIHCFPVKLSGKEVVSIVAILALKKIVLTAMYKNYTVELSGDTTGDGRVKGTLKIYNPQKCE